MFGDDVLAMGNQFLFYRFDDRLGWSNTPGSSGNFARSEYRHHIIINSLGMRDREPPSPNLYQYRIAVMGDSFTWGVGADYGERFTEILETEIMSADVMNFGVSGYGTTQHLLQVDDILRYNPDTVILAFCLSNDITEAITPFRQGYNKPFLRRAENGGLEIYGYPLVNKKDIGVKLIGGGSDIRITHLFNMVRKKIEKKPSYMDDPRFNTDFNIGDSKLYTPDTDLQPDDIMQKHRALDLVADAISLIEKKVSNKIGQGRFMVVFVPAKMDVQGGDSGAVEVRNEAGDQMAFRLMARGIDVVDPRSSFTIEHFWKRDGHWNAQGHALFGKVIKNHLSRGTQP